MKRRLGAVLAALLLVLMVAPVTAATSMTPLFGSTDGGTIVTITGGSAFSGTTTVSICGTTVVPYIDSGTQLRFVTPSCAAPGAYPVTTSDPRTPGLPDFTYRLPNPPTNDNLGSATGIEALPFSASNVTAEATLQTGEPLPPCAGSIYRTVWYSYTPTQDQVIRLRYGPYIQVVGVYRQTGSGFEGLESFACLAWESDGTRLLRLQAGMTYVIQAGQGWEFDTDLALSLEAVATPVNDDFAAATLISALPFSASDPTLNATAEPGEPVPSCSSSIYRTAWYRYTPAANQLVRISYEPYWQSLGLYLDPGSGIGGLVPVDCRGWGSPNAMIQLQGGQTYVFQVGQAVDVDHVMSFTLSEVVPPANDNFGGATAFTSLPFNQAGNGRLATFETGEPWNTCLASQQTVWYAFTPSESGSVTARADNGSLGVYVGSSVGTLTEVATKCGIGSPLTFHVNAATTYYLQVGVFQYGGLMDFGFSIDVAPAIYAVAWAADSHPEVNETVQFYGGIYDPVYAGVSSWAWTFGDGTTSAAENPTHQYATNGIFNGSLTAQTVDGRTASASFVVYVGDTEPPVLSLPDDIVLDASASAGVPVDYTATAEDGRDGSIPVTCTPASGSSFPLGATVVHCSATDAAGNMADGHFTVYARLLITKSTRLTQDYGTTIVIGADHVTLDCAGHQITGPGEPETGDSGIYLDSRTRVTVKHCQVTSFSQAIRVANSTRITLAGNTAFANAGSGIEIIDSSNIELTANTASENGNRGFLLVNTSASGLSDNVANLNAWEGVILIGSTDNALTRNMASNNGAAEVYAGFGLLSGSSGNQLIDNTANGNGDVGFVLEASNDNVLRRNTANANGLTGFEIRMGSTGNTLSANLATGNVAHGYLMTESMLNHLDHNTAETAGSEGFLLVAASQNTLDENTANHNGSAGIDVREGSNENILTGNTANLNEDGIRVFDWSSDNVLTGNIANGNRSFGIPVFSGASGNQVTGNMANRNMSCGLAAMWGATGNLFEDNVALGTIDGMDIWDEVPGLNTWDNNRYKTISTGAHC